MRAATYSLGTMLLAVPGCQGSTPPTLADCPDAGCRQAAIAALWVEDPEAAVAAVQALADPVEATAAITAMHEARPAGLGALCPTLGRPALRQHCQRLDARAHLRADVDPRARRDARQDHAEDPTPTSIIQVVGQAELSGGWSSEDATPIPSACQPEATRQACLQGEARTAAAQGRVEEVVGLCAAVDEEKWRHECFFRSAEALLSPRGGGGLRPELAAAAGRMCLSAGPFAGNCVTHLGGRIARASPAADSEDAQAWAGVATAIAGVTAPFAGADREVGQRVEARLWAEVLWRSMGRASNPRSELVPHVPQERSHLHRAALTAWVVQAEQPRSLEEVARSVEARLAGADTPEHAPVTRKGKAEAQLALVPSELWEELLPAEAAIPWTYFALDVRRPRAEEPARDLTLASLEAAARTRPPDFRLLGEGSRHDDPLVRWSAVRLLRQVDPSGRVRLPGEDEDPRVAARLALP